MAVSRTVLQQCLPQPRVFEQLAIVSRRRRNRCSFPHGDGLKLTSNKVDQRKYPISQQYEIAGPTSR